MDKDSNTKSLDKPRGVESLPCSRRSSLRTKGQLHRNILSADFDALFEWAKEREENESETDIYRPHSAMDSFEYCDATSANGGGQSKGSRAPYNSCLSLDPEGSNTLVVPKVMGTRRTQSSHNISSSSPAPPNSTAANHNQGRPNSCASSGSDSGGGHQDRDRVSSLPSNSPKHSNMAAKARQRQKELAILSDSVPSITKEPSLTRLYNITHKGLIRVYPEKTSKGTRYKRTPKFDVMVRFENGGVGGTDDGGVASRSSGATGAVAAKRCKTHRVVISGAYGVGKRAMIHDFLVPQDYMGPSTTVDDEDGEKSVSILLDGEESTLEFVDLSDEEISDFISAEQIDAYVVVYSVEDRRSFETAIDRLYEIQQDESREVAVILVANKTDLVRTRVIFEEEGKAAAHTYDCKYIEVSAAIDHKIDELLVGILKQIRLIKELKGSSSKHNHHHHGHRRGSGSGGSETKDSVGEKKFCCPLRAKHSVIEKLFGKTKRSAKSCENLYVL